MKLLLIEDEQRMAEALAEILRLENYDVDVADDGISGGAALAGGIYDIAIVDAMLPGKSGFEIVKEARSSGIKTPLLMLTARSGLDDKILGLDSGADDYMTKPFMTAELLARLRALIRRNTDSSDGTLSFGDIVLHTDNCILECTANQKSVRLKEKEYKIMEYLMANKRQVVEREQLAVKIWGYENEAEYNNVEVYMTFTRKKLAFIGSNVKIKAVRGLGYELRCDDV